MIIEYVDIVEIMKDEREEHKYIYNIFGYNDINYSMFFTHYKHLFNINLNHLKIRIISTLVGRIVDIEIICDK